MWLFEDLQGRLNCHVQLLIFLHIFIYDLSEIVNLGDGSLSL